MLMALLPALRDLRAPLVAGFLMLTAAWLVLHDRVPSKADADGTLRAIYELSEVTGRAGVLMAATFLSFLLGSVVQFAAEAIGRLRNIRRGGPRYDLQDSGLLHAFMERLIVDDPELLEMARQDAGGAELSREEVTSAMVVAVSTELARIARRMRGSENELYDEYDRLIAEAQFREITLVPLAMLIMTLAATWSWLFVAAAVILPVLKRQAVYQREAGHEVVMDALLVGKVAAPYLERLQRRAAAARSTRGLPAPANARWT